MPGAKGLRGCRRVCGVKTSSVLLGAGVLAASGILAPTVMARWLSRGRIHTDPAEVPPHDVALVLGAQVLPSGRPSRYLRGRLDAAIALYRAGRVRAVLVSGDNGTNGYDEPGVMRSHLEQHGIPAGRIVEDHAGFDTYDSMVRARRVFGADSAVLVSQAYHLPRAIAIARLTGLDAVGFADTSMPVTPRMRSYELREVLAGVKMVLDVVGHRRPVLGPRETSLDAARA